MKLGVSACLLGTPCRYDGVGASDKFVVTVLQKYFDTVSYCPETIIWEVHELLWTGLNRCWDYNNKKSIDVIDELEIYKMCK